MKSVQKNFLFFTVLMLVFHCTACHDEHDSETIFIPEKTTNAFTLDDVYVAKITKFIEQKIILYEAVVWDDSLSGPAVTPSLWLSSENVERYIDPEIKRQHGAIIRVISSDIRFNANSTTHLREAYYQGLKLKNDTPYYLQGSLCYRSEIEAAQRHSQEFMTQIDQNIANWPYTFEFRLTSLSETPPQ